MGSGQEVGHPKVFLPSQVTSKRAREWHCLPLTRLPVSGRRAPEQRSLAWDPAPTSPPPPAAPPHLSGPRSLAPSFPWGGDCRVSQGAGQGGGAASQVGPRGPSRVRLWRDFSQTLCSSGRWARTPCLSWRGSRSPSLRPLQADLSSRRLLLGAPPARHLRRGIRRSRPAENPQ